jgi:hypothetical protein
MKASRAARLQDQAGAEVVGALILFGLFVTIIALLNITAVPAAGLGAENDHYAKTLSDLNALQSEAEAAALPGNVGATLGRSIDLGPATSTPKDFFSYFLATPAQASGELSLAVNWGNVTVSHTTNGGQTVVDVGNANAAFPYGRLTFDPHPNFRPPGVIQWEDGGIVTTAPGTQTMRFSPPVTVSTAGSDTVVGVRVRVLNGTDLDIGGVAPVRLTLVSEAVTLDAPASDNARSVTLRLETSNGPAWGAYLNATSAAANATGIVHWSTTVQAGAAPGGLDVVTWTISGQSNGSANDVRLTTALAVYKVSVS